MLNSIVKTYLNKLDSNLTCNNVVTNLVLSYAVLQQVKYMNTNCSSELIDFASEIADAVGEVHRKYYRHLESVEIKDDKSPVTLADQESEQVVRDLITKRFPEHGVIGEEYPNYQQDAEYVWIVDPIDCTKLFVSGKPTFGLLLALAFKGEFILGVIDITMLNERWIGANGYGTYFNGLTAKTRKCSQLNQAVFARQGYTQYTKGRDHYIDNISQQVQMVNWGIAPHDYGLVASGYIDLIVDAGPKLHDFAPLDPIIRNAGGRVCDWEGNDLNIHSSDKILFQVILF